ncbi:MAG: PEP/pyruvate-binding domain-containing protein [Thermodesulfobacteriota bacterium]
MDARRFIRQITAREPLNPYQIAGMTAVLNNSAQAVAQADTLHVELMADVLTILDRTGEEASLYLVGLRQLDSQVVLFPKFPLPALEDLVHLTSYEGRRLAIREHLVPVLHEIPNWLDLVEILSRYTLDRDENSMGDRFPSLMEVILGYLFAAARQPFDPGAREQAEYSLSRLLESIFKSAQQERLPAYLPFMDRVLDFLTRDLFAAPITSFERRLVEIMSVRLALKSQAQEARDLFTPKINRLAAQAVLTALNEIRTVPADLVETLNSRFAEEDFPKREEFCREVLDRINRRSDVEIARLKETCSAAAQGDSTCSEAEIRQGTEFIRQFGDEWKVILTSFQGMIDVVPMSVQEAFSKLLVSQILAVDKADIRGILVQGLCDIVVRLERLRRQSSKDLVNYFLRHFLETAGSSTDDGRVISSLTAIEALGVVLGRNAYFLMAQELIELLKTQPLISPRQSKFTLEDDDTGEPLVLAEETGANKPHVQHIRSLLRIIASNPRIMRGLIAHLTIQLELGRIRLCDEDLIQYEISAVLRANSPVAHFHLRTMIKAIPYSFKAIGPLDDLRLTAAGLAKELANRGVKPVGNFLGKLRGDIHWRGSVENFYFCLGIIKYLTWGDPRYMSEWMPEESMPYLQMDNWCSTAEANGIADLCNRIFRDNGIDPSSGDGLMHLIQADTAPYRNDQTWPDFSRRVVLAMVELVKGLHRKYFVVHESTSGAGVEEDLTHLERIVTERRELRDTILTPDIAEPIPDPVYLTEGRDEYLTELARTKEERPGTPIILKARKTGHAYAQTATYIEDRFEAFNRDLTLEALQETLATTILNMHFERITLDNLPEALRFLDTLVNGLAVNGHSSYYLVQAGRDLRRAGFLGLTFDKVRDLVKVVKSELDDIHNLYRAWFEEPFDLRLAQCPMEELPRKLRDLTTLREIPDTDFYKNYLKTLYISDLQARDGNLRVMETFLDKVQLFLNERLAESKRKVPHRGNPFAKHRPFYFPDHGQISPCRIGVKASLLRFARNTPPYFVITTDQRLKDTDAMLRDRHFLEGLKESVTKLERVCGKRFGDPANPALFSVRSGSRISMPGMMITLTNVGINDAIAASLAAEAGKWFAYDSYRRFLEEFATNVFRVARDEFQDIIDDRKKRWGVVRKALLSGDQMEELAFSYKNRLAALAPRAVSLLDNGEFMEVLVRCAMAVLQSYEGPAARKYREAAGIDGDWKTPAIVQAMAYGNMQFESSGTGVVSYDPLTMELVGEFSSGDQGTDVVDGKVSTIPVYDLYKQEESLASLMPGVWKSLDSTLRRIAEQLHMQVNVEYTIERGELYILQIRKRRGRKERIASLAAERYEVIAKGTGVCGKIFRGIMVTDRNQIAPFRHINKAQSIIDSMNESLPEGEKLDGFIFVVNDPIPEDIMDEVFSLPVNTALVSRLGGGGAHAADIARSLNKVYIAQVRDIVKFAGKPEIVKFVDRNLVVGSKLVIHGQTGEIAVYKKAAGSRCQ